MKSFQPHRTGDLSFTPSKLSAPLILYGFRLNLVVSDSIRADASRKKYGFTSGAAGVKQLNAHNAPDEASGYGPPLRDTYGLTLPLFSVPVGLRISQHTGGHMKGKRYTEQQILDILGQLDAGTPISDLTRLHGVASATIYRWKAKYGGMTKEETRKFRQLEVENQRLKKLVADLSLDNVMLKEVVGRKW